MDGNHKNKIIDMAVNFAQTERMAVSGCLYSFFENLSKQSWYIGQDMLDNRWAGMNVPIGYNIHNGNICFERIISKDDKIDVVFCRVPAIVSSVGRNIDNYEFWVQILFTDIFGSVHYEWISQQDALSRRGVMKLADRGVNLIEKDASVMNGYLSSCLQANRGNMQSRIVTDKNGWKCDNTIFAFGEYGFTKDRTISIVPLKKKTSTGLNQAGSFDKWKEAAIPILKYPILRFKMYAVLAAPLLRLLNVQSFILDHSGETSIGKTFSSDFAMSLIGDADALRSNGDATKTAAEVLAEAYTDLPLYMDETGTQQKEEAMKAIVYMLSNEQGRMRGHKDGGLRETGTWKTIAFTTGERPLTSNKSFSGQQIRVIEIQGGFTKEVIDHIKIAGDVRKNNYGHIAAPYFENLFAYMDRLPEMYHKARKRYITVDNVKTNRIADSFAVVLVAGMLLEDIFNDMGIETKRPHEIVDKFFKESMENNAIVSYSVRALHSVVDWTKSKSMFFDDESKNNDQRTNEFYGWISNEHIDVIPTELRKHLDRSGFDSTRVLNDWVADGIVKVNRGRKDYKITIGDEQIRVVRFNRERINNAIEV